MKALNTWLWAFSFEFVKTIVVSIIIINIAITYYWEFGCPGAMLPLHTIYILMFLHVKVCTALAIACLCSEMTVDTWCLELSNLMKYFVVYIVLLPMVLGPNGISSLHKWWRVRWRVQSWMGVSCLFTYQKSSSHWALTYWYLCFISMVYQAKVLEPLGAVTTGSQFLEPDGNI